MLSVLKIYGMLRAPLDVIKILMRHICVATTRRLERDSVVRPSLRSSESSDRESSTPTPCTTNQENKQPDTQRAHTETSSSAGLDPPHPATHTNHTNTVSHEQAVNQASTHTGPLARNRNTRNRTERSRDPHPPKQRMTPGDIPPLHG